MLDAASYPALWALYDRTGLRPEYALPVFQSESGLNPGAVNHGSGAVGLNQILPQYLPSGVDAQDYATWSASDQLTRVIIPSLAGMLSSLKPAIVQSGTRFYQANYLPATINGGKGDPHEVAGGVWRAAYYPSDVVVSKPGSGATNESYDYNAGLDHGGKGFVTVADLGAFVSKAVPYIQGELAKTYALRPNEVMRDPVVGDDPYLGPNPPPPPGRPVVTGTNIALAVGGSAAILAVAGLVAWGITPTRRSGARENPVRRCPTGSQPVSLLFPRDRYTTSDAKRWARSHGYRYGHTKVEGEYIHVPQSTGRFARIRTITFGRGIKARVGWKRC